MKRMLACALWLAAIPVFAQAQGGNFDFTSLDVSGNIDFNFNTGHLNKITNGAKVTLYDADGAGMKIQAATILFEWPAESPDPTSIILDGNVAIEQDVGTIRAGKAVWRVADNTIVFTGSPFIQSARVKTMTADRIEIDLGTGETSIQNGDAKGMVMAGGEETQSGGAALKMADVTDWSSLIVGLQAAKKSDTPSPGRQILQFISPQIGDNVGNLNPKDELSDTNKSYFLKELNRVLREPALYTAEAWDGIALDDETKALAQKGPATLSPTDIVRLNRHLVEAAFPGAIAKSAG